MAVKIESTDPLSTMQESKEVENHWRLFSKEYDSRYHHAPEHPGYHDALHIEENGYINPRVPYTFLNYLTNRSRYYIFVQDDKLPKCDTIQFRIVGEDIMAKFKYWPEEYRIGGLRLNDQYCDISYMMVDLAAKYGSYHPDEAEIFEAIRRELPMPIADAILAVMTAVAEDRLYGIGNAIYTQVPIMHLNRGTPEWQSKEAAAILAAHGYQDSRGLTGSWEEMLAELASRGEKRYFTQHVWHPDITW